MKTNPTPLFFYKGNISRKDREITLDKEESNHLVNVFRLPLDSDLWVFNGEGISIKGVFSGINSHKQANIQIEEIHEHPRKKKLTAIIPVIKFNKLELVLEKLTELGIDQIKLYYSDFNNKKIKNISHKLNRWQSILISAAKQSRNYNLPSLDIFENLGSAIQSERMIVLPILEKVQSSDKDIKLTEFREDLSFLVGSEGGFSRNEIELLEKKQLSPRRLCGTILRVETAAIVMAGILVSNSYNTKEIRDE